MDARTTHLNDQFDAAMAAISADDHRRAQAVIDSIEQLYEADGVNRPNRDALAAAATQLLMFLITEERP